MKKFSMTLACVCTALSVCAQAKLETKKFKISDIGETTMEIVLTGNMMVDAAYRDKAQDVWHISPYEFCTEEQFEQRKTSTDYYFIVMTDNSFGKETSAGIKFLSMYKGDPKAGEGVKGLYKITSIPFCPSDWGDGREADFLPVALNILQQQVQSILSKELNIGDIVRVKGRNVLGSWPGRILIAQSDLAPGSDGETYVPSGDSNVVVTDQESISDALDSREDCLIGYVVAPENPEKGSVCFTYLVNASTYELHYMRRRNINPSSPAGFTRAELKGFELHDIGK